MDGFFRIVDGWIKKNKKFSHNSESDELKGCIFLMENGWAVIEYRPVPKSNATDVCFASGAERKEIRLGFADQVRWLGYLESREEATKNDNAI
jgi:hypothetical protein